MANKINTLSEALKLVDGDDFPPFFEDARSNFLIDVALALAEMHEWDKLKVVYEEEVEKTFRGWL